MTSKGKDRPPCGNFRVISLRPLFFFSLFIFWLSLSRFKEPCFCALRSGERPAVVDWLASRDRPSDLRWGCLHVRAPWTDNVKQFTHKIENAIKHGSCRSSWLSHGDMRPMKPRVMQRAITGERPSGVSHHLRPPTVPTTAPPSASCTHPSPRGGAPHWKEEVPRSPRAATMSATRGAAAPAATRRPSSTTSRPRCSNLDISSLHRNRRQRRRPQRSVSAHFQRRRLGKTASCWPP
jgi:hypothetical protein